MTLKHIAAFLLCTITILQSVLAVPVLPEWENRDNDATSLQMSDWELEQALDGVNKFNGNDRFNGRDSIDQDQRKFNGDNQVKEWEFPSALDGGNTFNNPENGRSTTQGEHNIRISAPRPYDSTTYNWHDQVKYDKVQPTPDTTANTQREPPLLERIFRGFHDNFLEPVAASFKGSEVARAANTHLGNVPVAGGKGRVKLSSANDAEGAQVEMVDLPFGFGNMNELGFEYPEGLSQSEKDKLDAKVKDMFLNLGRSYTLEEQREGIKADEFDEHVRNMTEKVLRFFARVRDEVKDGLNKLDERIEQSPAMSKFRKGFVAGLNEHVVRPALQTVSGFDDAYDNAKEGEWGESFQDVKDTPLVQGIIRTAKDIFHSVVGLGRAAIFAIQSGFSNEPASQSPFEEQPMSESDRKWMQAGRELRKTPIVESLRDVANNVRSIKDAIVEDEWERAGKETGRLVQTIQRPAAMVVVVS